jgi:hypothetical protein
VVDHHLSLRVLDLRTAPRPTFPFGCMSNDGLPMLAGSKPPRSPHSERFGAQDSSPDPHVVLNGAASSLRPRPNTFCARRATRMVEPNPGSDSASSPRCTTPVRVGKRKSSVGAGSHRARSATLEARSRHAAAGSIRVASGRSPAHAIRSVRHAPRPRV